MLILVLPITGYVCAFFFRHTRQQIVIHESVRNDVYLDDKSLIVILEVRDMDGTVICLSWQSVKVGPDIIIPSLMTAINIELGTSSITHNISKSLGLPGCDRMLRRSESNNKSCMGHAQAL